MSRDVRIHSLWTAVLVAAVASAPAACSGQPEPSRLDAEAQRRDNVTDVLEAYSEALSAQAWDSFLELFWPGATASAVRSPDSGGEPQVIVSQVPVRVADLAPILASKPVFDASLESPAVFIENSLAIAWSPSATRIGEAADPSKVRGVDAITMLFVGYEWKIISIAYQADAVERPLQEGGARQSILTSLERYYSDFSARNWTRFATHFWPDATISAVRLPPGEDSLRAVVLTVPEFVDRVRGTLEREPIFEVRLGTAQVVVRGNLAQVWAQYRVRLGDVNISDWGGVNAFTLIRYRNRWRVVSLGYDTEAPEARRFRF